MLRSGSVASREEYRAKIARLAPREAALMFTDIAGYTKLIEEDPPRALALLEAHNEIIQACVDKHDGTVAKVLGDAHLVEFFDPVAAARCALEVQVRLASRNLRVPADMRIHVRIGLHYATVIPKGQELVGDGLTVLSGVESAAPPGGICMTEDFHRRVTKKMPLKIRTLGPQRLPGVPEPVSLVQLTSAEPSAGSAYLKATHVELMRNIESRWPSSGATPPVLTAASVSPIEREAVVDEPAEPAPRKFRTAAAIGVAALVAGLLIAYFVTRDTSAPGSEGREEPLRPAARAPSPRPAPPPAVPEKQPQGRIVRIYRGEGLATASRAEVLSRLSAALARMEKLPRSQQRRILPDIEDWKKTEKAMARGDPRADVDRRVLASLERVLAEQAR